MSHHQKQLPLPRHEDSGFVGRISARPTRCSGVPDASTAGLLVHRQVPSIRSRHRAS
jgi:hypothetical protein